MAKKTLTPEEQLLRLRENLLNEAPEAARYLREPTYRFQKGDKVAYGFLKDPVIEEVLEGGKVYLIKCISVDNNYGKPIETETYRLAKWMDIRPINCGTTEFSENRLLRLSFNNTTVESLLFYFYNFGVDMNPDYQRDYVWSQEDKEYLIDSVFKGIDIGKFVFVKRTNEQWRKDHFSYEILDGKQRMNTLMDFFEDRLTYQGYTFSQLSAKDRNAFRNHLTSLAIVNPTQKSEVLKYFLALNRGGRVMDTKQIEKVEDMLAKLEE